MSWALILAQIPNLIKLGENIFEYVQTIRAAAMQAGEWPPEIEAQFQAMLEAAKTKPQWQPDKK